MTPHWIARQCELRAWLAATPRILLGCDFDGTLAPLASHADEAQLSGTARASLQKLMSLSGVAVAVISGRSLEDIRQRVRIPGILLAGNHGLEMLAPDGTDVLAPGMQRGHPQLREVLAQLDGALAAIPGAWIEDKNLTVSIHHRLVPPDHHAAVEKIVKTTLRGATDLTLRHGKMVWEIRPAGGWHKGAALEWFMRQCGVPSHATAFIGDDETDFDAFSVLPDGWTFVVGEASPQSAKVRLRDPEDTAAMMAWMAEERGKMPCPPSGA